MVYTVTFNPALDYVVRLDCFTAGEVNRTTSEEIQLGGKGINVSTILGNLGVENVALGFLAGFTGKALESGLRKKNVRTDFIWLNEGLTRINVKIKADTETEINGQGPAISRQAYEALLGKLDQLTEGDILVISGSIPAALPSDLYQRILARVQDKKVLAAVDATRDLICNTLPYGPFLIKPNRHELGEIFGKELTRDEDICACAAELQRRGARNVLVSMAGDGSLLLDERGQSHRMGVPKGTIRNSVGAGDSMVAGFLAGWLERSDYDYALRLGTAAGAATAFSDELGTKKEIMALLSQI